MSAGMSILVIGSLPPFRSAAAALGLSTTEALAESHNVTFVVDDLAPAPPGDLGFPVIRLRDLRANWGTYQTHQRLYIPGSEGDSLFPLEMLQMAPGVVMPASLTLFPLAESVCRATGLWPGAYWHWLKDTCGAHAGSLYAARVHHRRVSHAQATATPALDLLLEPATALIAASPAMGRMMKASGLTPDLILDLPPVAATQKSTLRRAERVLYVSKESAVAQTCRKSLSVFGAFKHISHLGIHPAARHLAAALAEADVVVVLDGEDDAASPALAAALLMGKALVTAGQPWTRHLPGGSHIALPHSKALDTLATSIAALLNQAALMDHITRQQVETDDAGALAACLQAAKKTPADLAAAAQTDIPGPAHRPDSAVLPGKLEVAALIGAAPPPPVLQALLPSLDIGRCPRFSTPALVGRLSSLTGEHPANLLARIGYEAPVIQDVNAPSHCHREPVSFARIREGLRAQTAISFGCTVEGGVDGDTLLEGAGIAPSLNLRIDFDEMDRNAPTLGFLSECGLFWNHDTVRHAVQCVLVVGHRLGSFRVRAADPGMSFMVAGLGVSTAISGGTAATLASDSLGLLEFRLMALDSMAGTPLPSDALRKQLAQAGLILEWSAL